MSSDTPRTDEQINGKPCTRFSILAGDSLRDALVPSEFARQLERELNAARFTARNLADENAELGENISELKAELALAREELQKERARLDALRNSGVEALMIATAWAYVWSDILSPKSVAEFKKHEAAFLSAAAMKEDAK